MELHNFLIEFGKIVLLRKHISLIFEFVTKLSHNNEKISCYKEKNYLVMT